MTGQTLLNMMEMLAPELQLQSGESDVTRGLLALNAAQDYFEGICAQAPGIFGGSTGNVSTANGVETTAYPVGFLRLDKLQFIDPGTNRPAWDLNPIYQVGGHAPSNYFPYNLAITATSGRPVSYWTDGANIYWDPLPDGTHTARVYGFKAVADITAGGTFTYPDMVALPLATFAVRVIRTGLDDPVDSYIGLARELFDPVISSLESFRRERGRSYTYRERHDT